MSLNDELGSRGLETHAPLDADDGVTHVAIAAYGVGRSYFLYLLYGRYLVVILLVVDGYDLSLLEGDAQQAFLLLGDMLQVSLLGQPLRGVKYLATADAGAPNTHVVGVFQFGEVCVVAMVV